MEHYVEAVEAGDRTDQADALAASLDGLPDGAERKVSAFVLALRGAPANQVPDEDGVESEQTERAFEQYVTDTCGEGALPTASSTTTSTTAPDSSTTVVKGNEGDGSDGSTGDEGTDSTSGSGSGAGSGSASTPGSSSGSGSGSGSNSGSGSGTDGSMDSGTSG